MRCIIFSFLIVTGAFAMANELDREAVVSDRQIELHDKLPQTVLIRVNEKDPSQVEVAFLKDKLPAGATVTGAAFEKLAMNKEVRGIPYTTRNELDVTSSIPANGFFK